MKILDVGCGHRPLGTVNVDLKLGKTIDRREGFSIDRQTRNLVNASGAYLPFRDNYFDEVISRHTIEHVDNPVKFVRELIRVSRHKVTIVVPHRLSSPMKAHREVGHRWFFSVSVLHRFLGQVGNNFTYYLETTYKPMPHRLFPVFNWFYEINIYIVKSDGEDNFND